MTAGGVVLIRPLTLAERRSEGKKREAWQTLLSLGIGNVVYKPYNDKGESFNEKRRARHDAMLSLGLVRVKGSMGGTFYE